MIEINNLTKRKINEGFLKKIAEDVLKKEKRKKFSLSVAFVGEKTITRFNKKYRKNNSSTDILSFQYNGSGELIICLSEIAKNAKKYKENFKKELVKILIHGILHLLGYDHKKNERDALKMEAKEEYYLKKYF